MWVNCVVFSWWCYCVCVCVGWGDFGGVVEVFGGGEGGGGKEYILVICRVGVVCIVFWLRWGLVWVVLSLRSWEVCLWCLGCGLIGSVGEVGFVLELGLFGCGLGVRFVLERFCGCMMVFGYMYYFWDWVVGFVGYI